MKVTTEMNDEYFSFVQACLSRLKQGGQEYGDRSFSASPDALIKEIQEELLDVACWSFILFSRVEKIRQATFRVDLEDE